jgi:POT family proton-dependent oligopeptide transporter
MKEIRDQTYNKETFLYSISRMLERASFFGLRSLIVLYMIGETMKMERSEALSMYGWFSASIILSQIIGALLGDLVIGNRKSIIIGGILQALGAFSLCFPSTTGLYIGLFLVVLGGGLYTPNIISNFGKLYLSKTKLLDSRFTLFYLAVNLGAFIGVLLFGYLGDKYGWNIGFIVAGLLMFLSVIPILISKEKNARELLASKLPVSRRITNISVALVFVGLFWAFYEISNIRLWDLELKLIEFSTFDVPKSFWQLLSSAFYLPISLIAIILWTYFYSSQFFKLLIGFIFGAMSFIILFIIPDIPSEHHAVLYFTSLFFLSISEVHITPIVHSILTQYTNPKYLAIMISLAFIPIRLFSFISAFFIEDLVDNPSFAMLIGFIAMSILSIGLIIYIRINKKSHTTAL